ncbi:MAG: glycosyl hydrolase 53 family protein [Solirubrobacterales bacterium]|nr:glycosyl hydrolase 53 family protein [Solirubrobacterales bacterium]
MLVALLAAGSALGKSAERRHDTKRHHHNTPARQSSTPPREALNVALTGTATATTEAAGSPAANAIDGNASTQWCSTQWTGSLTVDLGQVRSLSGVGVTLGANTTTALVELSYATTSGSWQPVPGGQQQAVPAAEPVYWPERAGSLDARYVKIDVTDNDGTPPCIGELRLFQRVPPDTIRDRGADLSFEPQEEAAGAHFTDDGVPGSALSILGHHGLNYVRLRLWVNPPPGYSDLANDLRMARRIEAAGDRLYLDIHYSDFWADPQHQNIPAAWQGQDLSQLTDTVRQYTEQVISAFAAQGTPVDMVSIGNEIRNGILWPIGQVNWTTNTGWDNLTTLLKAGVDGARAANPRGHQLLVMLHFDQGGDNADSRTFYDHMVSAGVPFDVIGLSYYPFFHGTLSQMRANVDDLAVRYHKGIVIAESQYPWTLANGDSTGNFVWQASQLSVGYPDSPAGQLSFYNDLLSILAQVPGHRALGLFYWEPEWIPGVGWEPGAGTPNDNLTLFSFTGQALPSVGLFESPLAVCAHYAPYSEPCTVPGGASAAPGAY